MRVLVPADITLPTANGGYNMSVSPLIINREPIIQPRPIPDPIEACEYQRRDMVRQFKTLSTPIPAIRAQKSFFALQFSRARIHIF